MKRTTRRTKKQTVTSSSSEDEDDKPIVKKLKTPQKKNRVPKDTDESSSDSDIENYLQPVDKINLMSSFFDVQKKDNVPFDKVEKNIFAGVTRLSDSDSDSDVEMKEDKKAEEAMEVISQTSENVAKEAFQRMDDYNKQLEEAKLQIAEYEANKKKNEENAVDISHLLIRGENVAQNDSIRMEDLHSSDFESDESDEGWEEIKTATQEDKNEEKGVVPSSGLQITVNMPDAVKKKKGVDLVAALKRRLNRIRKENQVYVHKVHLLCMLGHGNFVNSVINKEEILKSALKLLPSEKAYPSDRVDLEYLERIVKWYKKTMKLNDKDTNEMQLDEALQEQILKKEVYNKNMLCYIFIALMRALGIQCRFVLSLQVEPLRPPASELHSLSTKTEETKKTSHKQSKPSASKANTVNTSKINISKLNKSKNGHTKAKQPAKDTKLNEEKTKTNATRSKSPKPKTESKQKSEGTKTSTTGKLKEEPKKSSKTKDVSEKSEPKKTTRNTKSKKEETSSKESLEVPKSTRSKSPNVKEETKSEEPKKTTRTTKAKKEETSSKESLEVPKNTRSKSPNVKEETILEEPKKTTRTTKAKKEETSSKESLEVPKNTRSKSPIVKEETKSVEPKKTTRTTKAKKEETSSKESLEVPKSTRSKSPIVKEETKSEESKKTTRTTKAKKEEISSKESLEVPKRTRSKSPRINEDKDSLELPKRVRVKSPKIDEEKAKSPLIKIQMTYDKSEVVVNKMEKETKKPAKEKREIIKVKLPQRSTRRNNIPQLDGSSEDYNSEKRPQLSIKLFKDNCTSSPIVKNIHPHYETEKRPQLSIKLFRDYCNSSPTVNDKTKVYQSFILPMKKANEAKKHKLNDKRKLVIRLERMNFKNLQKKVLKNKLENGSKVPLKKTFIAKNNRKQVIKIKWPWKRILIPQLDGNFDDSFESDVPMDSSEDEDETTEESDVEYITNLLLDGVVDSIPQVDGADDVKTKKSSKPNLKKLRNSAKEELCPKLDKCSKKLKVSLKKLVENDSGEEFSSPRTPFNVKNVNSPKINLSRLKNKPPGKSSKKSPVSENASKYHSPPGKQMDVRDDIVSLIKGRISEQKQIDRSKMVKKPKKKFDSDSDSDYAPDPIEKKHHDSDDEFAPKVKVKQRVSVNRKASPQDKGEKPKKKGNDVWCEVFLEAEEKWISVDVVFGQIHCVKEIFSRASHPISYVVAWNNNNNIRDISARYCQNFNTVTRKLRIDAKWWESSLKPFEGTKTVRDKEEDDEMERQQLEKPLPTVIGEYKNHPLYALERHLLKFEAIYPPEPPILGYVRKEPVFPRNCVYVLKSRDIWLKEAKTVKMDEKPYRSVKARPKYDKLSNKKITDQMLEVFGPWQVEDYDPPTAQNGVVPRNAFGNVDLFKLCMLPKKCVHLQLPGLNKVARKLNIDCAAAIVGFDFHGGWSHPTYDGFVVCEEFKDTLIAAWEEEQIEIEKKEGEKIDKRVYGNWKRLIKGLLIRERLKRKYDFGEPSGEGKKKGKGIKLTNKRKIESDSE
ncbi:unnamed protein product [Brassicogethes aeneus]|uniref:VHS domain-containing protein n=1 Tax=Brassicogethes aeneus TaxID=1431903 RepID=A0A9P0B0M4_BRAAE|nr:unnamed protein product [Brassicogethes aeneus]